MKWSRRHALVAGLALIVLTNAVALVGAAYNRGGAPESALRLTERELAMPYRGTWGAENSGLSLELAWRVRGREQDERIAFQGTWGGWTQAAWLDAKKLEELGIAPAPASMGEAERRRYRGPDAKEVLVVLELDGPAYQGALQSARARAEQAARAARDSETEALRIRAEFAQKQLLNEETNGSRLFVVDAGLDADALRARYPDRQRYAIVKGRVRPPAPGTLPRLGYVDSLSIGRINVPVQYRPVFDGAARAPYLYGQPRDAARFDATVAFGKRLEPWLVAASRRP